MVLDFITVSPAVHPLSDPGGSFMGCIASSPGNTKAWCNCNSEEFAKILHFQLLWQTNRHHYHWPNVDYIVFLLFTNYVYIY